ncbi:membrane-spanning 4-domains subfamily A member 8 isoform X3 [Podarcis lilfordi]|uniref:Membrane-spanning 4-domains subfamily A member 8 isoform X3 n=1 Tax=Podarcis lilfordi TaxID=74358 RepID=A0AA35NT61_9SAUR|nr:membrane-spanning 4-domains subfamily A member 8 isoform X3 [Podarcis lilfordi]
MFSYLWVICETEKQTQMFKLADFWHTERLRKSEGSRATHFSYDNRSSEKTKWNNSVHSSKWSRHNSGVAQYIDEQLGSNQPERKRWVRELEKKVKVEAKTLGAIQIMIGLIQIGFGIISFFIVGSFYAPLASVSYFPCWGGIFFIVAGSISVSTTKYRNRSLVKCNVGMQVTSATLATIGIILYTAQLCINQPYFFYGYPGPYPERTLLFNKVGNGLCTVHLLFCLLEFCITVPTAHFGCQATCCNKMDMDLVPIVIVGDDVAPAENNPAPPTYSDIMLSPSADG